jgi:uncharacterized protein YecA (UPF0149 family)
MSKELRKVQVARVPGDSKDGAIHVKKYGRNEPCPCGSGLKVKQCCCGREKQYFYIKKKSTNTKTE